MLLRARTAVRLLVTAILVLAAFVAVVGLWEHYMVSPWTRDGQVRVQVANIAPQVSGQIVDLQAHDNQFVHKGDILYTIDKVDYQVKVDEAVADLASKKADMEVKQAQNARRQELSTVSTSIETKQQYAGNYDMAVAAYQSAQADLEQAKVNLERTDVRSTVNGFVTNLLLRVGNYANTGSANISVIDSDSFWISGYFEETKLGSFVEGDPAKVYLMGFSQAIDGVVESITRGISTANATVSTQGLPSVDAVYTWVRLAQRIPVRVKITNVPPGLVLSAGMTATVIVTPENVARVSWWDRLSSRIGSLVHG